ncbi:MULTISPECIES: ABC transporter ATP-binding protein [unclassified Planococcus (in: firmicutes)]|uniref:ABC transporter ATP-binding protein n=1 Tax=unclassified Planococcus (in: firmicutes) TaxID=2662419 RepID=UPI000C32AF6B|nr:MULTISPECIES: ABC transporter ATP-binding protein [unclassified Planococcus (in: firmicutes)]AUD14690.1 ABC transporter ATP-binding protein [Planococcus sp. MB-3u-03]PKG44996.1 ABC transporter ATP-binding protein [Planococcus sp. Urea-trap-24]PKG87339.1 ABC transporter ATP-binding protein [Planococcus sp. Urea-3u-39]PKH42464.1 ABC transporter ATP-binding protein [Planococcus sp. MB-3u-09]
MKTVFSYTKPYSFLIGVALFLMLLELVVELLQPLVIASIIDDGIVAGDQDTIIRLGLVLIGLSLIAFLSGVANSYFASHVSHSFSFDVRRKVYERVQSFSLAMFNKFPASGLITRLTSDIQLIQQVLYMSLRIMLRAPLLVIGSMVMAFVVNAQLAIYLIIVFPVLLAFLYVMVRKGVVYFSFVQQRLDKVNRMVQENLQAVRLIKAYLRGKYEANRFSEVAGALKTDTVKAFRIMEIILPILLFGMNVSLLAVVWFGAFEIQSGDAQIGELVAIVNYAMRMTGAFSMFSFIIMAFARAMASTGRIEEILLADDGGEESNGATVPVREGTVRFDDVSFTYPGTSRRVLENISFELAPREKLAIMGATGSGKTSLLQLIPRFYEATEGSVSVHGRDVREWDLQELRKTIGLVPQQSMLFTGSISNNLSWGKEHAELPELTEAAEKAQIDETVQRFPKGYETRVGQKGVNLSGGQKQRLSIARALVRKPSILILDDSTSALDVKTESALWAELDKEQATTLLVTQKVRTAMRADRILLLEDGVASAYGTHEELLDSSSLYREIALSQQAEEVDEYV